MHALVIGHSNILKYIVGQTATTKAKIYAGRSSRPRRSATARTPVLQSPGGTERINQSHVRASSRVPEPRPHSAVAQSREYSTSLRSPRSHPPACSQTDARSHRHLHVTLSADFDSLPRGRPITICATRWSVGRWGMCDCVHLWPLF